MLCVIIDGHLVGLDAHELGVVHVLVSELEHSMRQRSREKHVQTAVMLRQPPQHEANVLDEAEIEHAVCLVEHEHLNPAQPENALLVEIDDPTRRADQNVDAGGEHRALFVVICATERKTQCERQVLAKDRRVGVHLHGELASRRQDQRARGGRARLHHERRAVLEPMKQRDQKRSRLSGSSLGLTRDVLAFQRKRQSLALNRRALNEAGFGDSLLQSRRQWEVGEAKIGEMVAL
jgi:hypothetical protein